MPSNLWWIRRDLRLADNPALSAALAEGAGLIPVFVLDPYLLRRPAEKRRAFLFASLRALDDSLRARGSRLIVRAGPPADVLPVLVAEAGAAAVYAEADYSPYARRRDAAVTRRVDLRLRAGLSAHPPESVLKSDGTPYTVFTPYSRAWQAIGLPQAGDLLPAPRRLPPVPEALASEPLPAAEAPALFPAGEAEAARRLRAFTRGERAPILDYAVGRDRLDLEGTSTLSPYLRFGLLSVRTAVVAARAAQQEAASPASRRGAEIWLNELIWREFYIAILYHFPAVRAAAFRPALRRIVWRNDPDEFAAWRAGHTGYPVIDAAMRQLAETGWMHNRARMLTASFLVKDLLIDWRWGEDWFMRQLVDGDPAANNGGWQWTAGVGTDAAPYFRIFNPVLQSRKFDPGGAYLRRWIPELADCSDPLIHAPWEARVPPAGYPAPIVERGLSRARTLAAYQAARAAE